MLASFFTLSYDELREDLPARSRCCFLNGYREATFSINKATIHPTVLSLSC